MVPLQTSSEIEIGDTVKINEEQYKRKKFKVVDGPKRKKFLVEEINKKKRKLKIEMNQDKLELVKKNMVDVKYKDVSGLEGFKF